MIRLDGKRVSAARRERLKEKVEAFRSKSGVQPGLAVILVGEDPASQVYVASKIKSCREVGMNSIEHRLPSDTTMPELLALVAQLNQDDAVHGILVQLPLPSQLKEDQVLDALDPKKDVDGLKTESMGLLWTGRPRAIPCTPAGIMAILDHYGIGVEGMEAVVVGRSNIVGKPMAHLLSQANATVTLCHSRTKDLAWHTRSADLVVVAAGKPRFLGKDDFKKGSVVIDVGIHRLEVQEGEAQSSNKEELRAVPNASRAKAKLCGDVRFEELENWASAATPVPGGVGPMTITMLLENTFHLAQLAQANR